MNHSRNIKKNFVESVMMKIKSLFLSKNESTIPEIIEYINPLIQILALRMKFTLQEYQQQRIPRTYQRLRRAILLSLNTYFFIIFAMIFSYSEESSKWMQYSEKIFDCQRLDLLIKSIILTFCIAEWISFKLLIQILNYRSPFVEIFLNNLHFDYEQLTKNNRHYLFEKYLFLKIMAYLIKNTLFFGFIFAYMMQIYSITHLYFSNRITLVNSLFTMIIMAQIFLIIFTHLTQLLIGSFTLSYLLEFLKIRMKQLRLLLKQYESCKGIIKMKFALNRIQKEYVELYDETALLNKMISFLMLNLDTASKIIS
ncbi:hypothetical protein DERP_001869 [Dermatophagoides pteronyssinus]|uniref:Gustatory receptor n=1 Tax=Dermatophagoides pteronyssinus TaxID=6956 RepID=A0ABQ8JBP3_DERPT|nr:hypothetical protein DERP_001869 [Dermatophagoides pteronyssinus]